jgi:hypothetical protein
MEDIDFKEVRRIVDGGGAQGLLETFRDRRTPLQKCLDLWLRWLHRGDSGIGWRGRSAMLESDASASSEQLYDRMDNHAGEAVDAMIDSLPTHQGWAIRKRCGLVTLWRFPLLVYADVLAQAEAELEKKLKINIATRNYFQ